ncbi:MAG: hypothetical protein IKJ11_00840 [Clostridia bacterium]|nr:hypothetical protein [Clostridia bacterium]
MKKAEFLGIAVMLNRAFGVVPLLYGSLGLEIRLGMSLNADDVDILIPETVLFGEWDRLVSLMEKNGYRLCDAHEHAFEKSGVSAAFASLENLRPFAGVDIDAIPVIREAGVSYLLLELPDYLKVYLASAQDGYRKNVKNKQDEQKIRMIRSAIRGEQ